jgi:hypothetical protein
MEEGDNNKRLNRQTWLGQPDQIKKKASPNRKSLTQNINAQHMQGDTPHAHRSYQPVSPTR